MADPPKQPARLRDLVESYEPGMLEAVIQAITVLLKAAKTAVIPSNRDEIPDADNWPDDTVWDDAVHRIVVPKIEEVWGAVQDTIDTTRLATAYIGEVTNRLKDFSRQAWEEVKYELQESVDAGETITQTRERIGNVLGIDALSRQAEAKARDITRRLEDESLTDEQRSKLEAERRTLYRDADRERGRWEYRADRIARTETIGAGNASMDAYGVALETLGRQVWRQWWAITDTRVRPAHWVAHQQVVGPGEKFRVGGFDMAFPGDPRAPASLVINCRCLVLVITDRDEADAQRAAYRGNRPERRDVDGNLLDDDGNVVATYG